MNHTEPQVELTPERPAADHVREDTAEVVLPAPSGGADLDAALPLCRRLVTMRLPDADEVTRLAGQLREAAAEARRHDGGRSRAALRSAELLRLAIEHHDDGGDAPCPTCTMGRLDGDWRADAAASLAELRDRALAAQAAAARLAGLLQRAHCLIDDLDVPDGSAAGVSVDALHAAVAALRLAPGGPEDLADHLTARYPAVFAAARAAQAYAEDLLRRRDTDGRAATER